MKCAIITLSQDFVNYGNKLQNYGIKKVLSSIDIESDTILYFSDNIESALKTRIEFKHPILFQSLLSFSRSIKIILKRYRRPSFTPNRGPFCRFANKYLSYKITKNNRLYGDESNYDLFVTGSDQVWNVDFLYKTGYNAAHYYFLSFCERDKRITFSPSFGGDSIPSEYLSMVSDLKEKLNGFDLLSIREHSGYNILRETFDLNATVTLDPTLMLTRNDWICIADHSPREKCEKYLLTLLYHGATVSQEHAIQRIADKHDLKIWRLCDMRDKDLLSVGPSQFIDLIHYADCVITDSFHGTCFSVLFEKPFYIIMNKPDITQNKSIRLSNFLELLCMQNRVLSDYSSEQPYMPDYSMANKILVNERKKTINFLCTSITRCAHSQIERLPKTRDKWQAWLDKFGIPDAGVAGDGHPPVISIDYDARFRENNNVVD
jgi:hypothetical protein